MSPGSRGGPDLERYVGTDLISSFGARENNQRLTGGRKSEGKEAKSNGDRFRRRDRPISVPDPGCDCGKSSGGDASPADGKKKPQNVRRGQIGGKSEEERTPLSRLAIHTQGAPLIRRDNATRKNRNGGPRAKGPRDFPPRRSDKYKEDNPNVGRSDCLSVASDESSGSGHSENCLPRIIKPRKRRKKDRKPVVPPTESPLPEETVSPTEPHEPKTTEETSVSEDELHGPKLHHSFEDVTESDPVSFSCSPSSCQCRYCDPSGIWDAPQNSVFSSPRPNGSFRYLSHSDLALRRSWSEPVQQPPSWWPKISPAASPHRSNSFSESRGKRSDETRWESLKGCDIDPGRDQCLQVSTEIVTSPNGHRDIEIRFYSA